MLNNFGLPFGVFSCFIQPRERNKTPGCFLFSALNFTLQPSWFPVGTSGMFWLRLIWIGGVFNSASKLMYTVHIFNSAQISLCHKRTNSRKHIKWTLLINSMRPNFSSNELRIWMERCFFHSIWMVCDREKTWIDKQHSRIFSNRLQSIDWRFFFFIQTVCWNIL